MDLRIAVYATSSLTTNDISFSLFLLLWIVSLSQLTSLLNLQLGRVIAAFFASPYFHCSLLNSSLLKKYNSYKKYVQSYGFHVRNTIFSMTTTKLTIYKNCNTLLKSRLFINILICFIFGSPVVMVHLIIVKVNCFISRI